MSDPGCDGMHCTAPCLQIIWWMWIWWWCAVDLLLLLLLL